jgi:Forkhead domain
MLLDVFSRSSSPSAFLIQLNVFFDSEEISQSLFDATAPNVTTENAKVNGGKSNYQRRAKPPFSYIALIAMAIQDSQSQRLTLAEINDYLMKKFPFFRGDYTGWRNSVRHNLSLNECFQKVLRDPNRPWGKDNYWMLNESSDYTFADGVFRRRRKRLHKKSKCKTGDRDKASSAPTGKAYTATTGMNNFNPEHKHGT